MFTLVSGVYHWLFSRPEVCILLVGLRGSGKTTFFEQLKDRYAKCGSKFASGLPAPKTTLRGGTQNEQEALRQHDKQKQQRQPCRQVVTQEERLHSDAKRHKDDREAVHRLQGPPQHRNQQQRRSRNQDALECAQNNGDTCFLPRVSSTTGMNYCRFRYKDVDVVLWDLAGGASFHATWVDYHQSAHCVLYFVDSTSSAASLKESRAALNKLTCAAVACAGKQGKDQKRGVCPPPLLVVAAKQDLAGGLVSPRNSVQAVFSCDDERCCNQNTPTETLRTHSHHTHGRGDFLKDSPPSRCPLAALILHSACSVDSVEEILQYAVRAAKAYYDFLSVPLVNVTTQNASSSGEESRRLLPESANAHDKLARKAASRKRFTLFQSSRSWPVYCDRRYTVASRSARTFPGGTQTRNLAPFAREKPAGRQLTDFEAETRSVTDEVEVPCWHYTTTVAEVSKSDNRGEGNECASAETCIEYSTSPAYESSAAVARFAAAASQLPYVSPSSWGSSATDQEAELKRKHSGLYDLDEGC